MKKALQYLGLYYQVEDSSRFKGLRRITRKPYITGLWIWSVGSLGLYKNREYYG